MNELGMPMGRLPERPAEIGQQAARASSNVTCAPDRPFTPPGWDAGADAIESTNGEATFVRQGTQPRDTEGSRTPFADPGLFPNYPTTKEDIDVGCMDDRPWDKPWLQTGGGAYGVGEDRAAGMELEKPGSFTHGEGAAAFGHSVPVLAGVATGIAQRHGVNLLLHKHCAAYDLADTKVAEVLSDSSKETELFETARAITDQLSGADEDRAFATFQKGIQAYRRVIDSGSLPPRDEAETDLMLGRGYEKDQTGLFVPPSRVELTKPDHTAGDVVITHTPDVAFDGAQAWEQGRPAYNVSAGALAMINNVLNDSPLEPVQAQSFSLVSAIRHAAIISVLPRPEGQDALNIHQVRH